MDYIPRIGFGTYQLIGNTAYTSTLNALKLGYRHIDTAPLYKNETEIGKAILDSNIDRSEIWITTKVSPEIIKKGTIAIHNSIIESLQKLNSGYIDLILLHAPVDKHLKLAWKALEDIVSEGKVRFIGVSNYGINDLEITMKDCKIKPYTNQIEVNPYLNRDELINFCQIHNISISAHTSQVKNCMKRDSKLLEIANELNITPVSLLYAWALNKNMIILPRSSNIEHMEENLMCSTIKLSKEIMYKMDQFHLVDRRNFYILH
jgi:methylglyoxal/glyoxal reductase